MESLPPGIRHVGRIVDLPRPEFPRRVCLLLEERLVVLEAPPEGLAGLSPGDLVAFRIGPSGRMEPPERLGGPPPGEWDETGDALRWRGSNQGAGRMAHLRLRHLVTRLIRAYFDGRGFIEVETPVHVKAPTPEPQFAPVRTEAGWLITSPEFQLKRMLTGGFEKIYRLGPVFRGGEAGRLHNPEFTLLEWYRAGADLESMADDLEGLLGLVAAPPDSFGGRPEGLPSADPALLESLGQRPYGRVTMARLFRRELGLELEGVTTAEALRKAALAAGAPGAGELPGDFEGAFFTLWEQVERRIGPEPLLVVDWPAPLASLARLRTGDPSVAERMELFAGGMELANGFAELTDPREQRERFERDLQARRAQGLEPLPLDEKFLAALAQGMPPAAGMALGVDRLVMLIGGAKEIGQVLPFTWDEL